MGPRQCGQVLESLRLRERSVGALLCSLGARSAARWATLHALRGVEQGATLQSEAELRVRVSVKEGMSAAAIEERRACLRIKMGE